MLFFWSSCSFDGHAAAHMTATATGTSSFIDLLTPMRAIVTIDGNYVWNGGTKSNKEDPRVWCIIALDFILCHPETSTKSKTVLETNVLKGTRVLI